MKSRKIAIIGGALFSVLGCGVVQAASYQPDGVATYEDETGRVVQGGILSGSTTAGATTALASAEMDRSGDNAPVPPHVDKPGERSSTKVTQVFTWSGAQPPGYYDLQLNYNYTGRADAFAARMPASYAEAAAFGFASIEMNGFVKVAVAGAHVYFENIETPSESGDDDLERDVIGAPPGSLSTGLVGTSSISHSFSLAAHALADAAAIPGQPGEVGEFSGDASGSANATAHFRGFVPFRYRAEEFDGGPNVT